MNTPDPAPRSSDAEGRMFWFLGSSIDNDMMNNSSIAIHRYSTGEYKDFGPLMMGSSLAFPESEIEDLQYSEEDVKASIQHCIENSRKSIPSPLLDAMHNRKFDITVLLKSKGGSVLLERMFKHYFDKVSASSGIETLASSQAFSAGHALFAQGERRLAYPSTKLMIHRPISKKSPADIAKNLGVSEQAVLDGQKHWVENIADPEYDHVLSQISEPSRGAMADLFNQEKEPTTLERKIHYKAKDAPGFITQYLDEDTPLRKQLENRYGIPINPNQYGTSRLAEFAVLSEAERKLQKSEVAQYDIQLNVEGGKIRVRGDFDNQTDNTLVGKNVNAAVDAALREAQ